MTDKQNTGSLDLGDSNPHFDLHGLPPELRNQIYHHILIKAEPIDVTADFKQPALINTCRQIRSETIEMWYRGNRFRTDVVDCDGSLWRGFIRHVQKITYPAIAGHIAATDTAVRFSMQTQVSLWTNLKEHCYAAWLDGKIEMPLRDEDGPPVRNWVSRMLAVMACAQELAMNAGKYGIPWKVCEQQLRSLREVAGDTEARWLV